MEKGIDKGNGESHSALVRACSGVVTHVWGVPRDYVAKLPTFLQDVARRIARVDEIKGITDLAYLPEYLSDEDPLVRERARYKLEELSQER